ncbi:MAG TPA: HDOD domain-containing protein [Vicinamibacterales bacterium]
MESFVSTPVRPERTTLDWLRTEETAVPMLPSVALRVIELVSDPEVTVMKLAPVVSKDQVLASRVIGLANSAAYAGFQPATTLIEAMVRLGTIAVRNVVVTVSFASRMHDPRIYGERGRELVDHAIGTAYLARLIAEKVRVDGEEAFMCGLLHDIGKLVILKLAHDYGRRTGRPVPRGEVDFAVDERHASFGGLTLKRWKLPENLIEPVTCHHDYTKAQRHPKEAAVAYAANQLAHRYGFGCDADGRDLLEDPVASYLGLDRTWLEHTDVHAPGLYDVARQILA